MCNIGMTCIEELADFDDVIGDSSKKPAAKKTAVKPGSKSIAKGKTDTKKEPVKEESKSKVKIEAKTQPPGESEETQKTETNDSGQKNQTQPKMSEAQKRAIDNPSRRRGISVDELETMTTEAHGEALEDLTSKDATVFIRNLQQAA